MELLQEAATTHRNKKVRRHAGTLLESLAEEAGWTQEELADRSVPTLGFDARGTFTLRQDGIAWTATLDANIEVVFRNADGKILGRLPAGNETERAARTVLLGLRKEVRRIVTQQSARLEEAMRTGHLWRPRHIHAHLFQHPIVVRLCQQLIFAGLDADSRIVQTFRPLEDGSCVSAGHDPVEISGFAGIGLAHTALLTEADMGVWRQHLWDCCVVPLFTQLY